MTGSIAPNRPGHHGTVVARTVGTVAISCNENTLTPFTNYPKSPHLNGLFRHVQVDSFWPFTNDFSTVLDSFLVAT